MGGKVSKSGPAHGFCRSIGELRPFTGLRTTNAAKSFSEHFRKYFSITRIPTFVVAEDWKKSSQKCPSTHGQLSKDRMLTRRKKISRVTESLSSWTARPEILLKNKAAAIFKDFIVLAIFFIPSSRHLPIKI